MKSHWLHKKGHKDLVIFCNGWGMDENPVRHLQSEQYDVLTFYDYSNLECGEEVPTLFDSYQTCSLIGWSMGVWAGQKIFSQYGDQFSRTVAVNGTLCPISDDFGIPVDVYAATLNRFTEQSRLKFYRRMCREKSTLQMFLACQPHRSVQDQLDELTILRKNVDCLAAEDAIYRDVLISENDWVVPTANQIAFWQTSKKCKIERLEGVHYPFNRYESWDELLAMGSATSPSVPQHP